MSLDVKLIQHEGFLEVIVSGPYVMKEAVDAFPQVLAVCSLTGISKVMIDCLGVEGTPGATEKVLYAFGIQDAYARHISSGGQDLRIAYVAEVPIVSTFEPGLDIAKNTNMPFELFETKEDACEWLGISPV